MNADRLEKYKGVLLELEERLDSDIHGLIDEIDSYRTTQREGDGDTSDEINTDIALSENDSVELTDVRAALQRIEKGTFGVCGGCEKNIPAVRLNVIPYAAFCVDCERARE